MTAKERIEKVLEAEAEAERKAKEMARLERAARSCRNCKHYAQHFTVVTDKGTEWLMCINAGHCIEPRIKLRLPGDTCERFERDEVRRKYDLGLIGRVQ